MVRKPRGIAPIMSHGIVLFFLDSGRFWHYTEVANADFSSVFHRQQRIRHRIAKAVETVGFVLPHKRR